MNEDPTILPFCQSETIIDPLTELARQGARRMLAEALKAEADAFVAQGPHFCNTFTAAITRAIGIQLCEAKAP